ncbi:MAG: GxxExxY protein [Bacteroidota bacterium]
MTENKISEIVFDLGLKIHRTLGPGLLESAYEECLFYELDRFGFEVERQKYLPLVYEDIKLEKGYVVDIMVEKKVIIELKVVKELSDLHKAQLLTYLKLSDCKLGLLINFNSTLFKSGVKRVINGYLD